MRIPFLSVSCLDLNQLKRYVERRWKSLWDDAPHSHETMEDVYKYVSILGIAYGS
jgi:hypothetical protein